MVILIFLALRSLQTKNKWRPEQLWPMDPTMTSTVLGTVPPSLRITGKNQAIRINVSYYYLCHF